MSLWRADPQFEYWPDIMDEPSLLYDADWPTMPESLMNVFGVPSLLARRRRISRSERRRYSRSEVLSDKDKFQVRPPTTSTPSPIHFSTILPKKKVLDHGN